MAVDAKAIGAGLHPLLADVGVAEVEFKGQCGRMLWYPSADLDSATLVIEAVRPGKIAIGSGGGESAEIRTYDTNIAIAMLRDQEGWLRGKTR